MNTELKEKKALLMAELKAIEEKEKKEYEAQKKEYEAQKDSDITIIVNKAEMLNKILYDFKNLVRSVLEIQAQKIADYGKLRTNSKGGFQIVTTDGMMKIRRRRDTNPSWDERSEKAIELIKDFLTDTVKKKDLKLFEILYSFIARNKNGDLEYSKVMNLLQHEDKYDDERWVEGLRLIKESYTNHLKGYQYDFEVLDEITGKFKRIDLNFSSI